VPYVKTSVRTTRAGTVRYLQLAHNEWDQDAQRSRTRVLYNFGREDELDREAVGRLVTSLSRLLEPGAALAATAHTGWEFVSSVPLGGAYVLDGLWRRLGIDAVIRGCVAGRRLDGRSLERSLFALVPNRALAPSSKLGRPRQRHEQGLPPGPAAGHRGDGRHPDGIPVRCWCWPGDTGDSALIRRAATTCAGGRWPASSGSATAGSPRRRTGGT